MSPAASLVGALSAPGDLIQLGMLAAVMAGQMMTWRAVGREDRRRELRRSEDETRIEAGQAAAIKEGAAASERLADALESLGKRAREHDLADAKWQATMAETQKHTAETLARCVDAQAGLQRQITNVALGIAPAEAQALPATRMHRRPR